MNIRRLSLLFSLVFLSAFVVAAETPAAPAPKILYVGAVSIEPCQDAKVLAEWYAKLGLETKSMGGMFFAKIETAAGTMSFAIHQQKPDAPARSSGSVALVFRVENLNASLAAAKAKGLAPESTEQDSFGHYAHFHDPDGNKVTLWEK